MNSVESEGKTVEEAVERALLLLDVSADEADVVVLQEPKTRLLGMSQTPARVRVTLKSSTPLPPNKVEPPEAAENTPPAPAQVSRETRAEVPAPTPAVVVGDGDSDGADDDDGDDDVYDDDVEAGELAADALQELLDLMDVECDVAASWDEDEERFVIEVSGPDTGIVIGRQGQTLDAVEFVLNRMLEKRNPSMRRVMVDAEGYRSRREEKLRGMALENATRVRETHQAIALDPMSPRDRRTVHMAIKEMSEVTTISEGEGRDRHVVIEPVRGA
jgi:spoIIIJ-associated protein